MPGKGRPGALWWLDNVLHHHGNWPSATYACVRHAGSCWGELQSQPGKGSTCLLIEQEAWTAETGLDQACHALPKENSARGLLAGP